MQHHRLFMVLLGCRPKGRLTEQHDVFFGIAESISDLLPQMNAFWPGSGGLHIDAWREISHVGGFRVTVLLRDKRPLPPNNQHLFFINLGGYRAGIFEEFHHKLLVVAEDSARAIKSARSTEFFADYKMDSKGGKSHVDDKMMLDADDVFNVEYALDPSVRQRFHLAITSDGQGTEDSLQVGYVKLSSLK